MNQDTRPMATEDMEVEMATNESKIVVVQSTDDGTAASFQLHQEDHTLGNALRYIIMKNPDVEFCGYSIPHPSEPKLNIRIQTWGETKASDALLQGLDGLVEMCDVIEETFRGELSGKMHE